MKIAGILSKQWSTELQMGFDRAVDSGYQGIESSYSNAACFGIEQFRDFLVRRSLNLAALSVPVSFADQTSVLQTALNAATIIEHTDRGACLILCDTETAPVEIDRERCLAYAKFIEKIADSAYGESGTCSLFQHHCHGFLASIRELDWFLSLISPVKVGFCFDVGQYTCCRQDPVAGIDKYGKRIRYVRFTDCCLKIADVAENREADFPKIARALENGGYRGWIAMNLPKTGKKS